VTAQKSAAGLTAVWARENTRDEIFSAVSRKEAYATTGTRISVLVFGGWGFEANDGHAFDFVAKGYRNGVPMGGNLKNAPADATPQFLIRAMRDPHGANLDRFCRKV
jgi:hypothetical protein